MEMTLDFPRSGGVHYRLRKLVLSLLRRNFYLLFALYQHAEDSPASSRLLKGSGCLAALEDYLNDENYEGGL